MTELFPLAVARRSMISHGRPLNHLEMREWPGATDRCRIIWRDNDAYISDEDGRIEVYPNDDKPQVYANASDNRWREL